jgi:hypothetical protein
MSRKGKDECSITERYQQFCSVRENQKFFDNTAKPAIGALPGK